MVAFPTSPLFRFDASTFRALLLRRLWRPLPLSSSACAVSGCWAARVVRVSDLDLPPRVAQDQRRLEVVADGLPLFHGAQLAIDTTMVSALRRDGRPGPLSARLDGAALARARRRKEITYPELSGANARTRLMVLPCLRSGWPVVGGVHVVLEPVRQGQGQARATCDSRQRPSRLVAQMELHPCTCSASRSLASSLLELRGGLDRFSGW